jgi:hypothetical protein
MVMMQIRISVISSKAEIRKTELNPKVQRQPPLRK